MPRKSITIQHQGPDHPAASSEEMVGEAEDLVGKSRKIVETEGGQTKLPKKKRKGPLESYRPFRKKS